DVFQLSPATLAAFPARRLDECYQRVDALLPGQFRRGDTVLDLDLMNINAVMHPAQMVCNASWIEATSGDFSIYQEGSGPAVARLIAAVDAERLAVAAQLGVAATPLGEILWKAGYTTHEAARTGEVYTALQAAEAIRAVKAPPTLDHRYLHEDVGWGLVPWAALAEATAVATPVIGALIDLAGAINGVDYRATGLALDKMGLRGMTPEQIVDYVRPGRDEGPRDRHAGGTGSNERIASETAGRLDCFNHLPGAIREAIFMMGDSRSVAATTASPGASGSVTGT